jgi:hypothetical protein
MGGKQLGLSMPGAAAATVYSHPSEGWVRSRTGVASMARRAAISSSSAAASFFAASSALAFFFAAAASPAPDAARFASSATRAAFCASVSHPPQPPCGFPAVSMRCNTTGG